MAGGPLQGMTVLEVGGIGPGPFAGMTLADMGADVIRIERPGGNEVSLGSPRLDTLNRGKRSICLDLKQPAAVQAVLTLVENASVLIEGYRPAVAERLGIGPDACWQRNPKLVYGRMTGWGQDGPLAQTAGHDIDYIALTGALGAIGPAGGPPQIPLNLLGDFGGGGMYLVAGVLAALLEAARTGRGQVVDAAIVDGAAHLLAGITGLMNTGAWADERGVNLLDGGAPFYHVYETADGRYLAVGAIEAKFYAALVAGLQVSVELARQHDRSTWPATFATFAAAIKARTMADWERVFAGTDACVAPIRSIREAVADPQIEARGAMRLDDGFLQPGVAPRFSAHENEPGHRPVEHGADTRAVLAAAGLDVDALLACGAAR